jgi:hypothetical protein
MCTSTSEHQHKGNRPDELALKFSKRTVSMVPDRESNLREHKS